MVLEGQEGLARRLDAIAEVHGLLRACSQAFERSARYLRTEIAQKARAKGIVRAVFARNTGKLVRSLKLGRVKRTPRDDFEAPLEAGGLLAIQETGGQLRPHTIRPKRAPLLVFVTQGRLVATPIVRHPGAIHPKMPAFGPELKRGAPRFRRDVLAAIQAHIKAAARAA